MKKPLEKNDFKIFQRPYSLTTRLTFNTRLFSEERFLDKNPAHALQILALCHHSSKIWTPELVRILFGM